MRHYLSALCLLFVSTCVFSAPAETPPEPALRIATPWPAQNAITVSYTHLTLPTNREV